MFRTKLSKDDKDYFYSNDVINVILDINENRYESFFNMIKDNDFAKENVEEVCFSFKCQDFYENDVIEDIDNSECFVVKKDIFGNPILITHNFVNIDFYVVQLFDTGSSIVNLEDENRVNVFKNGFSDIEKAIEYARHIILRPHHSDKNVFMSETIKINDFDFEVAYKMFFDLDTQSISVNLRAFIDGQFISSTSERLTDAFKHIGKKLNENGTDLNELNRIFNVISERIREG